MSDHRQIASKQLELTGSAVSSVHTSNDDPHTLSTEDESRNQDVMNSRPGPVMTVQKSTRLELLQLPGEIRNKIYRHCLVVGEVYPRPRPDEDDRLKNRSDFQKPMTQVFEVCRQIFTEAAPLYFAENKFVLSYGDIPWSWSNRALKSKSKPKPISRLVRQHLKSLSVTFDIRDCHMPPSLLQTRCIGGHCLAEKIFAKWNDIARLVSSLSLQSLEVSLQHCHCAFCNGRHPSAVIFLLLHDIRSAPRVVLRGFTNADERRWIQDDIFVLAKMTYKNSNGGDGWDPEYEEEDPNNKLQLAFRMPKQ